MFKELSAEFELSKNILDLRSYQEELISSNIANSETPNYKSKTINFSYELKKIIKNHQMFLKKTSKKHLIPINKNYNYFTYVNHKNPSFNGNTVNMNYERIDFLDNSLKYQADITFLNNKIKNITYVLQQG